MLPRENKAHRRFYVPLGARIVGQRDLDVAEQWREARLGTVGQQRADSPACRCYSATSALASLHAAFLAPFATFAAAAL